MVKKKILFSVLAGTCLALAACGGSKSGGEAAESGGSGKFDGKPLKVVAEAVMHCEGLPLEGIHYPQELQQKVVEKNEILRPIDSSGELIGATVPTEGREEFYVGIDSVMKVKGLEVGYGGSQSTTVKLETVIKITGEGVPHNTVYYAVGYDGEEPVVTFQLMDTRMVQGEQFAEYYTVGDRVRLSREVKITPANASRYARADKFIVTVEEDPGYQTALEAQWNDREEYIKKYGK